MGECVARSSERKSCACSRRRRVDPAVNRRSRISSIPSREGGIARYLLSCRRGLQGTHLVGGNRLKVVIELIMPVMLVMPKMPQ